MPLRGVPTAKRWGAIVTNRLDPEILSRVTAREVVKLPWLTVGIEVRQTGSHKHFAHPAKPGRVTVPMHAGDVPKGTVHSILRQAGLK
jgi:predicted RNA binding protein YcfA (HicA-like mRNA interferase family)